MPPTPPPFTTPNERRVALVAIGAGWLLILAYLVMLLGNLVGALREGAAGNLLARVFAFPGMRVDLPWIEGYALANILALAALYSLATRALLRASAAIKPAPVTSTPPTPTPTPVPPPVTAPPLLPARPVQPVAPDAAPVASPEARVFISHSSADDAFGHQLTADLRGRLGGNERVWYDSVGGLKGGDVWWDRIAKELTDREVFVILLSPEAMRSAWVHDELRMAWRQKNGERGKVIVPVLHRACEAPEYVLTVQFVRFDDQPYDAALTQLEEAVREGKTRVIRPEAVPSARVGPPFDEDQLTMPTRFIGREEELRRVKERLRVGGATGITAVRGIGGIGKTALAAVAVRELRWEGRFANGIAVILCNDKADPGQILREIIARFDAQRQISDTASLRDLQDAAKQALPGSDALVVLDNVEPDLDVTEVVRPLRERGVTVLLTARHQLPRDVVPQEGSLPVPLLTLDEALDLFAQSYGRGAALDLTGDELAAARRIVTTLEQHTLAVKLAGAWAMDEQRDLATLAAELEADPLKIPDDHETPRAVALALGRSVTALTEDARRLFAGIAAFATGEMGRQALLALATALELAAPEASAGLLVRRALLDATVNEDMPEGSDRERRKAHALLRAAAQEAFRRWSAEDQQAARRAVAEWYAAYADEHNQEFGVLSVDEANMAGAFAWAPSSAETDDGASAAIDAGIDALFDYLTRGSHWRLGMELFARQLSIRREVGNRRGEATTLNNLGQLAYGLGQMEEARRYFDQALPIAREVGNREGEATTLSNLGSLAHSLGQMEEARAYFDQALPIAREVGNRNMEATTLNNLGLLADSLGQMEEARAYYDQALPILREVGNRRGEATTLNNLGELARSLGQMEEARRYYEVALALATQIGAVDLARIVKNNLDALSAS